MSVTNRGKNLIRGCGRRIQGGIYICSGNTENGLPIERFLCCPPKLLDTHSLGLSNVGTKLIPQKKKDAYGEEYIVYHIFDIIGAKHYPNVLDFVFEADRFGVSRRVSRSIDFSKLCSESRLVLLHPRAHIKDTTKLWSNMPLNHNDTIDGICPQDIITHQVLEKISKEMCVGLWAYNINKDKLCLPLNISQVLPNEQTESNWGALLPGRAIVRTMPSFTYSANIAPGDVKLDSELAIIGILPIENITVIKDTSGTSHEESLKRAQASLGIDIELKDW